MSYRRATAFLAMAIGFAAAGLSPLHAADFTYNDKTNAELAKTLSVPIFFTLPKSARLDLPKSIDTSDKLVDFHHPDSKDGNYGLRIIMAKRDGFAARMAKSGLIQTGDILLTFRPEWGGGGAYPNIQMGISHTGTAFMRGGQIHHVDNPLTAEYNGSGGDFGASDYREMQFFHMIRPRDLTKSDRANLEKWGARLIDNSGKIYPESIEFNSDYNSPKYKSDKRLTFVKNVGAAGLLQHPPKEALFCSEFAWSLLALRKCDPASDASAFTGNKVPSCITPIMTPLQAAGSYPRSFGRSGTIELADGPLTVIKSLKLPQAETEKMVDQVFTEDPSVLKKMSVGHRQLAQTLSPEFAKLKGYYQAVATGGISGKVVGDVKSLLINMSIPDNYSPTSFLINTMLPDNDSHRQMDYVATVMFQ